MEMSSNSSKFRKATFGVRFIPVYHCGVGEIACWCDLLAIEEVSCRLGLTLATCGYIILQSCTIIMEAQEPLDPSRIGFLRSHGVVLGYACFINLTDESRGCSMARKDTNVNMRG